MANNIKIETYTTRVKKLMIHIGGKFAEWIEFEYKFEE